jgi:hypothetical protein
MGFSEEKPKIIEQKRENAWGVFLEECSAKVKANILSY